ncbi:MAG: peptidoglycan DD-metalloendopeptidase family protein [Bifidobacteriaceae bacterium]|jgi:murein DD-endopeptidase MepM/ murein hydrolase activator NlpD|nr:peptidoglycan DD-metalloendopeptidase family protein [Bifidobacteriaceae bacterium]
MANRQDPISRRVLAALVALTLGVLTLLSAGPAQAKKDRDDLEREREANLERLEELGEEIEDVAEELSQAFIALEKSKAELPLAQARVTDATAEYTKVKQEYDSISARLTAAQDQEEVIQAEIDQSVAKVEESKRALGEMARRTLLLTGPAETDLMLLLGATDLEQLTASTIASEAVTRARAQLLEAAQQDAALNKNREARLVAVAAEISTLKAQAAKSLDKADSAKRAAETAKADLDTLIANQAALAVELEHQKTEDENQQNEIKRENEQIASELRKLAQAQHAAAPDGGPALSPGMFGPPLAGSLVVTSPYGYRTHPILKTQRLHTGTDFSASCGRAIYSTADGTVQSVGYQSAWGNRTVISHGVIGGKAMASSYNHQVDSGVVQVGQSVTKGQLIGHVGTTGWSTGCHLHFEIFVEGNTVDPMPYLR